MPGLDPIFYVRVSPSGKNPERVDQSARIRSLVYEDEESKADKLKLSVDNYDLSNFDAPIWKTGNHVEVSWGYEGNMSPIRQMKIQKVTGSVVLTVEALDESVLLHKTQRVRSFEYMSRSEVARQIATEYGFDTTTMQIESTEEVLAQITQARMTDATLLRDMAKREGFEFYVDYDGFHFHPRRLEKQPLRQFVYFTDPNRGDILAWNVENDIFGAGKTGGATIKGIDPKTKAPIEVKAYTDADLASARAFLAPEGGAYVAVSVQNGVVTQGIAHSEEQARSAGNPTIPTTEQTQASAKRQAIGMLQKSQLQNVELTMECIGDPQMLAKNVCQVQGIGKTISGNYYVTSVHHKVGAGYKMSVKAKRDGKSSGDTVKGQGFTKEKPKPEPAKKGNENTQSPPADCDPTQMTCDDAPLVQVQQGSVSVYRGR